nr:hypothetical protein Iba_chr14aCG4220 [Ipomoea batatas]
MASSASTPGSGDGEAGAWVERENGETAALGSRAIMASSDASPFVISAASSGEWKEEIGGGGMLYDRDGGGVLHFPVSNDDDSCVNNNLHVKAGQCYFFSWFGGKSGAVDFLRQCCRSQH